VGELARGQIQVTDLGETLRHLADLGFDPRSTPTGEYLLAEVLKQHGVEIDRGMIAKRVPSSEVGKAMHEVLTACLAIGHLLYLSRGYRPATFLEEVSHFLAEQRIPFEPRHKEVGRTGKEYALDFFVRGDRGDGLLQTLSPATPAGATTMVNANFRLWSDIRNGRWHATMLDDRYIQWRREDILLLGGVSKVYRWTQRDESFRQDVAALSHPGGGQDQ
jgi:hypothetical protein